MKLSDFNYCLPEELIAQHPVEPRDASRLLVIHRKSGEIEHRIFRDIIEYLYPGDVLVINDTKVLPARIFATKETGAVIEVILLKQIDAYRWEVLVRPGKKAKIGAKLIFLPGELEADIIEQTPEGGRILEFKYRGDFYAILDQVGNIPLPPYIKEKLTDPNRYQTVYAEKKGSAAAPTAGLHFTSSLLKKIEDQGIEIARVLLHVGLGTFRPVKVDNIEEHRMHSEYYEIDSENTDIINRAKRRGARIIGVGTTSARTLETVALSDGTVVAGKGWTEKFIYPGYKFKIIDALLTNFHLPKSTLLMLVSAFADRELIMHAYQEAVKNRYRFFSFGDAMLII
ncbi:MAG: tRNA preQ1(34) S-adenosylmethionine ribosyltransferase-isomerase QueA [Bacillota bacterium]|jgi:S-adenosylmethionine:tRNA ribosyltransferase-isomerase